MKPLLTIFTPTYNRAHTLHKCYESLLRQTCPDFVWLIVDDGSTDHTKELVDGWLLEDKIPIRYYHQKNQGMHAGHNTAYEMADTELCMCIDSDDYLTDTAVEQISKKWRLHGNDSYAGMVCHNAFVNGEIVGAPLPKELFETTFKTVYYDFRHDKKYVYRREVFNAYPPYPVFPEERLTPLSCKYFLIDNDYLLLVLHEVVCIVEYMEDGSTRNIYNHYRLNPRGISYVKNIEMQQSMAILHRLKAATHYIAANIRLRRWSCVREAANKVLACVAFVPGILLCLHINFAKK